MGISMHVSLNSIYSGVKIKLCLGARLGIADNLKDVGDGYRCL